MSGGATEKKKQAENRGRRAESWAAWILRLKGYRVLAHGFRTPLGEVDLIARKGKTIVAVEVKQRSGVEAGLEAISAHQQSRISNALQMYLSQHRRYQSFDVRFDAMIVTKGLSWPLHIKNAW